jgi:hypothetical protein
MPRAMSPAMLAAIQAQALQPSVFVQIGFKSEVAYLWSGIGPVVWNGHTWIGAGSLMSISSLEDAATVEARGIAITLSGLDPGLLAEALGDFQLGLAALVWLGLWSGGSLLADPILAWQGRTDQPLLAVRPEQATIQLNCETRLVDMNIPVDRRHTSQDQQMDYPGDLGLQFVDGIQEMTLYWGQQANSTNNI